MPVPTHAVDELTQGYDHTQIQAPPVLLGHRELGRGPPVTAGPFVRLFVRWALNRYPAATGSSTFQNAQPHPVVDLRATM